MKHSMSILGIGGKLILYTALYVGLATALTFFFPHIFILRFAPEFNLPLLGFILLAFGIPLLMVSARQLSREFKEGILMTKGFFQYSRNPLYAIWIFLLIPGFALLTTSWIFFFTPFITYLVFKMFIKDEEKYLAAHFGQSYLDYKENTGQLIPRLKK